MPKITAHKFIPPYLEEARARLGSVGQVDIEVSPDQYAQYDLNPAAIINMLPGGLLHAVHMRLRVTSQAALVIVEVEYRGEIPAGPDFRAFVDQFRGDPCAFGLDDIGLRFQFIIERPLS